MAQRPLQKRLFGTRDIALIVGLPEWRVQSYTRAKAYRLPAALTIGSGKRKSRLYDYRSVEKMAVAAELEQVGFGPKAIGKAIVEVEKATLPANWPELWADDKKRSRLPVLVLVTGREFRSVPQRDIPKLFADEAPVWVFVLNFCEVWADVAKRLSELEGEGRISLWQHGGTQ